MLLMIFGSFWWWISEMKTGEGILQKDFHTERILNVHCLTFRCSHKCILFFNKIGSLAHWFIRLREIPKLT